MLICLRGCNCNSPFSSSEKSCSKHRGRTHQESFYGNRLVQGGALSFIQLVLCPSNPTSPFEEERQRSMLNFALWLQMIFCPYVTLDLWHCTMSLHVLGRDEANRKGLKCSQHSSFLSCVSFCQLQNIFPEKSASHQVHLNTGCVC